MSIADRSSGHEAMAARVATQVVVWTLAVVACTTIVMYNPLFASLWPILTGALRRPWHNAESACHACDITMPTCCAAHCLWECLEVMYGSKSVLPAYATGTCSPVLQPEARWAEGWGVGWLNFHGKLVREVQKADEKEVGTLRLRFCFCFCPCLYAVLMRQPGHQA